MSRYLIVDRETLKSSHGIDSALGARKAQRVQVSSEFPVYSPVVDCPDQVVTLKAYYLGNLTRHIEMLRAVREVLAWRDSGAIEPVGVVAYSPNGPPCGFLKITCGEAVLCAPSTASTSTCRR